MLVVAAACLEAVKVRAARCPSLGMSGRLGAPDQGNPGAGEPGSRGPRSRQCVQEVTLRWLRSRTRMRAGMGTSVEIPENLVAILHRLAHRRRMRGYSKLVQEAIESYLRDSEEARRVLRDDLCHRKGAWKAEEAERVRRAIAELRRWTGAKR